MRAGLKRDMSVAVLVALVGGAALVTTTTIAEDGKDCDPSAGSSTGCAEPTEPPSTPPPTPKPPPATPVPPPAQGPPAPQAPPQGPVSAPAAGGDVAARPPRDCRPGKRRGEVRRGCPRSRRRGSWERAGERVAREREARERERSSGRHRTPGSNESCEGDRSLAGRGSCAEQLELRGFAGIGASRPLPDPLPPGSRLTHRFAQLLERVAGSRWPIVLASLRASGKTGSAPADAATLRRLSRRLARGAADERVQALADYHRAVGLAGLTNGLHAVKGALIARVLGDSRVAIYPGGRSDVGAGRVDVRVLVTMLYLAERHGSLSVTSLISGHGVFTTAGHVSLHTFGQAMDIAAVGGVPIVGNQQPGGVTEGVLRSVLMLPAELRPSELISLFAIGGPSFAMADHADHVHVGF